MANIVCSMSSTSATPQQQNIANVFATGVLLSDSDAISFGIANFDPNTLFTEHPQQGIESESIQLRNQLNVTNLPFSVSLENVSDAYQDQFRFNFSYIQQKQQQSFSDIDDDTNKDTIYGFYSAFSRDWALAEGWQLTTGFGQHFMHHQNEHRYNSAESLSYQDQLDGQFYNLNSNAYVIEPILGLKFKRQQGWGYWTFNSKYQYFYGWSFGGDSATQGANPEGWEFTNTLKTHLNLFSNQQQLESLYLKAQRVDIGGDIRPSLGTDFYYEFGVGLLVKINALPDFIENFGIGVNVNMGSQLEGGSIVLYFNET